MMIPFLMVRFDKCILGCVWHEDPNDGPVPPQFQPDGITLVPDPTPGGFSRVGHTDTELAFWIETETGHEVEWIETATLDALRSAKSTEMNIACRDHIEGGFLCPALGEDHLYPAKAQDQANLIGSVTDSLLFGDEPNWATPFWCKDSAGLWQFRMHTRLQIQQVGRCGKISILESMQKNELIQMQIVVATAQELTNITWSAE